MSDKKSTKDDRARNWNMIVYPESAPINWREIINKTHIEWVESPLHDKDIDPNGVTKKSHWHVTLLYPGKKTYEHVKSLTDSINASIPVKCQSVKGSIRYMAHLDNPEKAQYSWNEIVCYGGVDLSSLCLPTVTEKLQIQREILKYIKITGITEFDDIVSYAMDKKLDDWLNILLNYSTMSINAFIRSRRHKIEKALSNGDWVKIDSETGEIVSFEVEE